MPTLQRLTRLQLLLFCVALGSLHAEELKPKAIAASPSNDPSSTPKEGVVLLEKFVLEENKSGAAANFSQKAGADTVTESVAGGSAASASAQNSSDLLKNTSGVTVNGGASGSSTVSVRGIDQRMLRITVDGQRQGGSGNPLDAIPAEIVQSLEVTKTFTPDMDADAVGGIINVNTGGTVAKAASLQGRHQLTFNSLVPRLGTKQSLTWVRPFGQGPSGPSASVTLTGTFEDQYKLRERWSALRQWTPQISPGPSAFLGQSLPVLTLPLIESTQEHRQREGLVLNGDARFGDTVFYLRTNLGRDWTRRDRNYNDTNPASGTLEALTPVSGTFSGVRQSRRNQRGDSQRDSANLSGGTKSQIGRLTLDANLAFAWTHEFEPEGYETGFVSDRTYRATYTLTPDTYAPRYNYLDETPGSAPSALDDPENYGLDYLLVSRNDATDREWTLRANGKLSLENSGRSESYLKFGGKAQQRLRTVNIDRRTYDRGATALDLANVLGHEHITFKTSDYAFGAVPNAAAVASLLASEPSAFAENSLESNINTHSGDYDIRERVWAAYAMGKLKRGDWSWLGGLRAEGTQVLSHARQMAFATDGSFSGFIPVRADNRYLELLPGLHLRFEPRAGTLYRASLTRSLSRPAYSDIAPFRTLSFVDHRSRAGAPNLKPYQSTNFDVSVDHYNDAWGLFTFGAFYKKIDHFITDEQFTTTIGNLGQFIEFRRINGEAAFATGLELNWQSRSWSLPAGMGKGSLEANYSFNHGEAHHPSRPGEIFPLPRQVDHQGNLHFHLDHGALSADLSVRYRTGWWEDLIAVGLDNFIEPAWDAELSLAYKLNKVARLTAGVSNLLNEPIRHYAGDHSRMNDYQKSGVDFTVGAQWRI